MSKSPRAAKSKPIQPAELGLPWARAGATVGLLLAVGRRPAAFFSPQFWAEDGRVFFSQADAMGSAALTLPHADYHHALMRWWAGGWIGTGVPVGWRPTSFLLGAVLAWIGVLLVTFDPASRVRWPGAMMLALVRLRPSNETWFNLTNVQWVTALLWALWWRADAPRTKVGVVSQLVSMTLVGLTGVFAIFATPLMLIRAGMKRTWYSVVAALRCAVTAGVQGNVARVGVKTEGGTAGDFAWGDAVLIIGKRVWGTLFVPVDAGGGS